MDKARYVQRQARASRVAGHKCHGGCGRDCAPAMWGCRTCWYKLPAELRRKIWVSYRPGQEVDKKPSAEYLHVAREVERYILENWHGGPSIKALTVCQPYAELICRGAKLVENRTWTTSYRGPLAIHAGKSREWFEDDAQLIRDLGLIPPFGAIVATVDLVDCLSVRRIEARDFDSQYPWLRSHEHVNGPWCWIVQNVRRLAKPVPYRGAQQLFQVPASILVQPL